MSDKPSGKNWSRVADAYSKIIDETDALNPVGAACKELKEVVENTLPWSKATFIIDMGCGTGPAISSVLDSSTIAQQIPDSARIVAADVAPSFVDMLRAHKAERQSSSSLWNRLEVENWDATDLSGAIGDGEVSHLLSTYAYFAFREEKKALLEAYRILQPGGIFIETSMFDVEWSTMARLFEELRPGRKVPGPEERWGRIDGVKETLESAGFSDVKARKYNIAIPFETHEAAVDMIKIFPWVAEYTADFSEEEMADARGRIMEFVRSRHPEAPLSLTGVALIGWGRKAA